MSFPSLLTGPSRLSGLAAALMVVALSVGSVEPIPSGRSEAGTAPEWEWPVGPAHTVVRPFIAPPTPYSAGHRGIDIDSAVGAAVVAPTDGIVYFAGVVVDRPVLSLRYPDGLISSFEPVASELAEGTPVARGSPIGVVAAGHCASACLHFGVRVRGEYVSPLTYLGGIPPSVLLPTRPL